MVLGDILSSQIPVVIELVAEIGGWINSSLSPIQAHGVQNHVWHNISKHKIGFNQGSNFSSPLEFLLTAHGNEPVQLV